MAKGHFTLEPWEARLLLKIRAGWEEKQKQKPDEHYIIEFEEKDGIYDYNAIKRLLTNDGFKVGVRFHLSKVD